MSLCRVLPDIVAQNLLPCLPLAPPSPSLPHAVVLPMRHLANASSPSALPPKRLVVGVCTQVDLLTYVMHGAPDSAATATATATASAGGHGGSARPKETSPSAALYDTGNSLDCAQLAWQFMKPPSPSKRTSSPPTGNGHQHLSRGRHEADCAQLAWQFMKPPQSKPTPLHVSPQGSPVMSQSTELDCARLAWQFMKPHTTAHQSASTHQPAPVRQPAPGLPATFHYSSPALGITGAADPPMMALVEEADDEGGDEGEAEASSQPTRFSSPRVGADETGVAPSKLALPHSTVAESAV